MTIEATTDASPPRAIHALWLGIRPYAETFELQAQLLEHVKSAPYDVLLLLEHEPCITLGRGAHLENLLADEAFLMQRGISVHKTDRGGDITLHAPGQLVAYPIVNLNHGRKDVRLYVRTLTKTMAALLEPAGLSGGEMPGKIGLWIDQASLERWPGPENVVSPAKIAAIGVRISRWVTMHGFALNLTTDLSLFQWIVPCGIGDLPVTSLRKLTGGTLTPAQAAPRAHQLLCAGLQRQQGSFGTYSGALELGEIVAALASGEHALAAASDGE